MKTCSVCHEEKTLDQFYHRGDKRGLTSECKQCKTIAQRPYIKKRRWDKLDYTNEVKRRNPCQCGETAIECLDFHHIDGATKWKNVSRIMAEGWSLKRLQEEIAKCATLCANCHRKLHAGTLDYTPRRIDDSSAA